MVPPDEQLQSIEHHVLPAECPHRVSVNALDSCVIDVWQTDSQQQAGSAVP
ncbi:MAG: hypothetical protein ACBR50_13225 [Microcoleus sp.]